MSWQQVAAVLTAFAPVLAWAVYARRRRAAAVVVRGRHRAGRARWLRFDLPPALPTDVLAPPEPEEVDNWTADLPTAEIPCVKPAVAFLALPDGLRRVKVRPYADVVAQARPRLSIADRLRDYCTAETPIFAALARELGLDQMLVAA